MEIPPGGSLGMSTSTSIHTWAWGLVAEGFASMLPEECKKFDFFTSKQGLSVPTIFDCPPHSSCIHIRATVSFVGLHHLPKFWAKNLNQPLKPHRNFINFFLKMNISVNSVTYLQYKFMRISLFNSCRLY